MPSAYGNCTGLRLGESGQQALQRVETCSTARAKVPSSDSLDDGAIWRVGEVRASAWAFFGHGCQIGKRSKNAGGVYVTEPERADPGCVYDPPRALIAAITKRHG